MVNSQPYNKYRENSIYTASPEELTLMLFNGLVKFIMQAQLSIDKRDFAKAHASIVKAKNILLCFKNTLDMKYEVSKDLAKSYDYMLNRLTTANIKKDNDMLGEVLTFAKELREAWTGAMEMTKKSKKA